MKIESSVIQLNTQASRDQTLEQKQILSIDINSSKPANVGSSVVLAHEAEYQYQSQNELYLYSNTRVSIADEVLEESANSRLLSEMVDVSLAGREAVSAIEVKNGATSAPRIPGFSGSAEVNFSQYQFLSESQRLTMSSHGVIKVEDGREIDFSLYLQLQQDATYKASESLVLEVQQMKDPLVINFGAESVSLTDQYFEFDLEGDGELETIASLGSGSGYLVLDRNGNGKIDDGTELFGTRTGQGFAELAEFDNDDNLWIDENDAIFSELSIWVKDSDGNDQQRSLKDVGVGAIYLGSASGTFALHSSSGGVLGEVKSSGLFLTESGEVRTIQEIDLADLSQPETVPSESIQQVVSLGSAQQQPEAETQEDSVVIAITNALVKLNEIREQQQSYIESVQEDKKLIKSPLEQLLTKMDEIRLDQLDKQRKKADSQYRNIND